MITSTTDAIAMIDRRPRADFSAAADRAARRPGPPGPGPPDPGPPDPEPPDPDVPRPPAPAAPTPAPPTCAPPRPDSPNPASPAAPAVPAPAPLTAAPPSSVELGRPVERRAVVAARSYAAAPAAVAPAAAPSRPVWPDLGAVVPPGRSVDAAPPVAGAVVEREGGGSAGEAAEGSMPREAQSSAARREDQEPAVSPRSVPSVGSGDSGRRAARRARVGGSGSVPAMDCWTHDGVPPAGRRAGSSGDDSAELESPVGSPGAV